jgi:hypothetical protein
VTEEVYGRGSVPRWSPPTPWFSGHWSPRGGHLRPVLERLVTSQPAGESSQDLDEGYEQGRRDELELQLEEAV